MRRFKMDIYADVMFIVSLHKNLKYERFCGDCCSFAVTEAWSVCLLFESSFVDTEALRQAESWRE